MIMTMIRTIIHPFEELNDVRSKIRNYMPVSLVILAMFFFASVLEFQATDFVFNFNRIQNLNIWTMLIRTILIFMLWTISNWAFCTLFDGEGTLGQIFSVSALALIPYIIVLLLKVVISIFLINEERIFLTWLVAIGQVYSLLLLLSGIQIIHGYTFKKTIFSAAVSIIGIAVILFIFILLFSLLQQFIAFFITIFTEISLMTGGG